MKANLIINPKYKELSESIKEFSSSFDTLGEISYSGRNTIRVIPAKDILLNVKSFKIPNIINQLIYGNFRASKAQRSFEYAQILLNKGINTPDPIAYIEEKKGVIFQHSYYISKHEEFDGMMRELKTGKLEGRELLLTQFAQFAAFVHDKEVLHIDFSPGNILYKKTKADYLFYLVDLNRMKFGKVSMNEGCENFRRLWGSKEMLVFIATEYAKARNFNIDQCIELTLSYHKKFWKRFTKKHPEACPYVNQ